MKPRIALLTSLVDFSPAYSPVSIILDQARLLRKKGYDAAILTPRGLNRADLDRVRAEGLKVEPILPQTTLHDYAANEPPRADFADQARIYAEGEPERGTRGYLRALEPYDTVITHDLMFLSWHLPQNAAIRQAIDRFPEKNWLHWIHSAPSVQPPDLQYPSTLRYSAAPESTYVFLNETQRHRCALMLGTTRRQVATVYNARDPRAAFSDETVSFIEAYDLFNHDLLQIYPFSTPRWREKGVPHLFRLFSEWLATGVRARLVLVNAHANSEKDRATLDAIEAKAGEFGLTIDQDVILSTRFATACAAGASKLGEDPEPWNRWRYTVPARVVRELFNISNLFVFPSVSECCSLIQAEAACAGTFQVLNSDFPPMREFATPETLAFPFTSHPPEEEGAFYECVAREVLAEYANETACANAHRARTRTYNHDWIWREQLEPLLWRKTLKRLSHPKPEAPVETWNGEPIITLAESRAMPCPLPPEPAEPVTCIVALTCVACDEVIPPGEFHEHGIDGDLTEDKVVPYAGMPCRIFGACSEVREAFCRAEVGDCMLNLTDGKGEALP